MAEESEIKKFYACRRILITGVSGFIGKVLLWKLLHSCSSVDKVYVLIRPKRGVPIQSRMKSILKSFIFDSIREKDANLLCKVVPLAGDISEDNFNLSETDRRIIIDEVSIIFHIAAALNMEADLKTAVNMNTTGTLRLLKLSSEMKHLEAFVHTSTAYCYCDKESTEEMVFPPTEDPYNIIHLTQWLPSDMLQKLTPEIIKPHPNTYTYTKRLAEKVVADYYPQLPIAIARPSIVIPSLKEPVPGWVDNLNGPTGILIAAGKGVVRSMLSDGKTHANVISVDIVCNGLISVAWKVASDFKKERPEKMLVVNLSMAETDPQPWEEIIDLGLKAIQKYPFEQVLWFPGGCMTTSVFYHYFIIITCQWLPAYFLDLLLQLFALKPFLVNVQKKVANGQRVLRYFTLRTWNFTTDNLVTLKQQMNAVDKQIFPVTMEEYNDRLKFMENSILVSKRVILKENMANIEKCRQKFKILYWVDCFAKFLLIVLVLWLVLL